ncbi:MAG: DUF4265 domain-containing protein [Cardiobacteriaceae bacterium]|nr:DUF4265 domain-containing protein [Cardiobacteriaceae bacterium]
MEQEYIIIPYYDTEDNIKIEEVLCEKVSDNTYRLIEIPLWSCLSIDDVIKVTISNRYKNRLVFNELVKSSNNSTVQIIEITDGELEKQVLHKLKQLVGSDNIRYDLENINFHSHKYISFNIPKDMDYSEINNSLVEWRNKNLIDFQITVFAPQHKI